MSDKFKDEMETRGVRIITNTQLIWTILIYIAAIVFAFGATYNAFGNLEKRVTDIEQHGVTRDDGDKKTLRIMYELQLNLKSLMKKQNVDYQQITE
jgi:hypothetical protein